MLGRFNLQTARRISIVFTAASFCMLIFLFALNTGRNYISSLSKPYNITAFKNGVSPDHVNHELMKFANLKKLISLNHLTFQRLIMNQELSSMY